MSAHALDLVEPHEFHISPLLELVQIPLLLLVVMRFFYMSKRISAENISHCVEEMCSVITLVASSLPGRDEPQLAKDTKVSDCYVWGFLSDPCRALKLYSLFCPSKYFGTEWSLLKGNSITPLFIPYKPLSLPLISLLFYSWNLNEFLNEKHPKRTLIQNKIITQQVGISNGNTNRTVRPWEVPGVSGMSSRWSMGHFRKLVCSTISFARMSSKQLFQLDYSKRFGGLSKTWSCSLPIVA